VRESECQVLQVLQESTSVVSSGNLQAIWKVALSRRLGMDIGGVRVLTEERDTWSDEQRT
jgi:hypothetical protein